MSEYRTANDYVSDWVRANQIRERRLNDLRGADIDLRKAEQSLGKFIAPKLVKPGDVFLLWVNGRCVGVRGDILLQVTIPDSGDGYLVAWRDQESGRFIYDQPERYKNAAGSE
jgi:hypothetical protein